ncbi:hypothetical protein ANN_22425 [Periplaneta americana]|uniref:SPIN-DOC-like zinc-finger domain-containing protein n=1 Tax=Periplaneta americana TaxID=6978 RepID=A0ABQ8S838_PERAM|nr:hypothetical protein ANN_22425 [Periplaneta americana]
MAKSKPMKKYCFQRKWEYDFVVKEDERIACLLCLIQFISTRHFNIKRHFNKAHIKNYGMRRLSGDDRRKVFQYLKQVVVITEDVQNVHLLLEYRPHIDVSLTCEHDPKLQEYCLCPQNMPQFDSEGIPNQAPETNKPMILNGPTSRNRDGLDQPVLTRWKTWLDAVNYYAEYYGKIMEVIYALDSTDNSAVAAVKLLPSEQILEDILFIDSNFKIVSKSITLLESSKIQLSEAFNIVYKVSQTVIQNNNSLISEKVKLHHQILPKHIYRLLPRWLTTLLQILMGFENKKGKRLKRVIVGGIDLNAKCYDVTLKNILSLPHPR